jgi:deoxyribonuclease (pyrimidine dimer)
MVRVNLLNPHYLADQHLVAEYYEILMLATNARKHPATQVPAHYVLGTGHIMFFKNKILYLKKRHGLLRAEMKRRGFHPKLVLSLRGFPKSALHGWKPRAADKMLIKKRLRWKLRLKPKLYRYYGKKKPLKFFIALLEKA